mmetsp:Transcript_14200/g.33008  ORF Transcript_14200/g.33008 Transcript_14200/m.33008 type:complete len:432 (-) Transcript_14200:64-1359(-)|eukprot:CAMPEP_0182557486 /NCGR_PEP_ID=MMETSP1324-20130603/1372_1 /TAXON_ID=236786 /ORGANISM="Florenciella sp., Strain RCC1587" /LENGTH=431 /DNA_ID=CAMNT_0024769549 /DNA_START=266 /DNA_END=1561 /DNA_ORIENTATION=+
MASDSKVAPGATEVAEDKKAVEGAEEKTAEDTKATKKDKKGKKGKKGKEAPRKADDDHDDHHDHEDHYNAEHHDQEKDNNTIHRPRVFSVRPQLTGTTSAMLKKKAAEKQAKQDEKDHNHIPLTEEEKESKRVMTEASHKRMREKSKEPAQACYNNGLGLGLPFHAETGEINLTNRGLKSDIAEGLSQVLLHQGLSDPPVGSLHSLVLRTNMIRFDGCERLCNSLKYDINRVLVYMDLSECSIGVKGAKAVGDMLKQNESLLEIRLKYNQIGHEGTAHLAEGLAHNFTLENLSLKGNAILDIGCEHLGAIHFGSLIDLDLRENYIGNHGCEALAKGFKGNRCLRRLNVRENPFGDEGRWAIGGELLAKKKKYWKKQKEKRVYEGDEYRAPTQREKDLAIPKIDFANLNIEPRPVLAWAVMTECPKCVCTVM